MRFSTIALAAAAAGSALGAQQSICDKYTVALLKDNTGKNQLTLLQLLVNTAFIGNFTGPGTKQSSLPGSMVAVPGIITPGMVDGEHVNLLQYFDGSLLSTNAGGKAISVNFLDGGGAAPILASPTSSGKEGSAQFTLLTHLYEFFGLLLGCSEVGKMGFPAYAGVTSMTEVHQFMALDEAEFTYFVTQVGLAALSFGVSATDAKAAGGALEMAFGLRCAPAADIVPGASPELQAICLDSDCPMSPKADCGAYPKIVQPAKVGAAMTMTGGGSNPTPVVPSASPTAFPGAAAVPTAAAGMAVAAAGALAAAFL